ncbi:hypothetical protein RDWZM_008050 [Blomia tropicalis]|uniref:Uncharacterized protein n=1 Tax=Blomia tropicalis TaxID=40697 RepID=A0A9Q0RII4_BLOTA|nr:hypothetical protein RDWZM_008050 [Blomia tropicalis]
MSYSRSSYKSSSYRTTATSSSDGLYSSRLRGTSSGDDADGSHVSTYTSRRTYNLDDGDDLTSMRTSRQSMRISSRFSTDSDLDADTSTSATTSRYSSKYKSLLSSSIADDDDDLSTSTYTRKYSRYGSRDESSDDTIGLTSTSSRLSRYRSTEGDDDLGFGSSTVTTSRRTTTRLSYLDEDDGDRRESSYSSRRFTSDSYKDSLDLSSDSYKVTTPTESIGDEIGKYSHYTFTDVSSTDDYGTGRRRYQGNTSSSTSRSLSRLDSQTKDAVSRFFILLLSILCPFALNLHLIVHF